MRTKGKFKGLAAGLVAVGMLASCSVNDDINEGSGDGQVRFTAGIGEIATPLNAPGSRAAGTEWGGTDKVGIFMVENGTTTIVNGAENRQYEVTNVSTGAFEAATDNDKMFYPQTAAVDFIAYYPYVGTATLAGTIDVTIGTAQTDASQPTFDLLYSNNATNKTKSSSAVELKFEHMLSKLVMNIVQPSSLPPNNTGLTDSDLNGMTVTIKGMNTKNTFDLSDGTLGTSENPAPITPRTLTDAASYDAIILPDSYANDVVTVEFTIPGTPDDEIFTWTLEAAKASFEGGNEYTYAVTLSRTGVTATGEINPWVTNGNDRGPVTAD